MRIVLSLAFCPNCLKPIVSLQQQRLSTPGMVVNEGSPVTIWPLSMGRPAAPNDVPDHMRSDYDEASIVLPFSAKASAALSRRCLQSVLAEAGQTQSKDLDKQIVEVLSKLPSFIAKNLDAVRNIGNFAAHPQKSINTGAILDVEPGEAEWNLDVLDALFDFYYVRPKQEEMKRAALDAKLKEAGKGPLKQP